jgi:drug/metabolite transporter (DMT)-like permease
MTSGRRTLGSFLHDLPRSTVRYLFGDAVTAASARPVLVLGAASLAIILWASVYSGLRVALEGFSAGQLAFLRLLIASIVLSAYAAFAGDYVHMPARRDWPRLGLIGLIGFAAYYLLLNVGQRTVDAGTASFIINTTPALSALLAVVFLKETLRRLAVAGIAVSLAGVGLIAVSGGSGMRIGLSPGALVLLCAALAHAVYFILQKAALKTLSPFEVTVGCMWAGTVCLLPFAAGLSAAVAEAPPQIIATTLYVGIFPTALSHLLWAFVLKHLPASTATSLLILISPTAVLIGAVWLGETPSGLAWLGGILAISGVVMVQARTHR